jgi:hypothetical protein
MKTLLILLLGFSAYGQNVNIPDANFKAYLVGNAAINTNMDTEIQLSEATAFTGIINCPSSNISDLTGIEAFTALDKLYCENNNLTSLDVTQNTALTVLWCLDNQLTSLDVTQNTALAELYCFINQLTSLDVSQNTALTILGCNVNQLTSLDVSNNTALIWLNCDDNQLTCLNVKNGNNTNFFAFSALNNPNLTCIEVDDAAWSTANWTNIDAQNTFSTDCANACSSVGLNELSNTPKQLIKIIDLMGRETNYKPNTPLIYIYDDGSRERVFKLEK